MMLLSTQGLVALAVGAVVGLILLSRWLDARKGSQVLNDAERVVAESLGYESYAFRTPEGTDYRVRDLRESDLRTVGQDSMHVVASYGCPGGGTLVWGGSGLRHWLVFPDGTTKVVPYQVIGDHVVGWPYHKPDSPAQSLRSALNGVSPSVREKMRYVLREKWIEGEDFCWREVTVIRLPQAEAAFDTAAA